MAPARRRVTRQVNRALHEARRPLQVLALDSCPRGEVAAIADALDQIDAAVNGKPPPRGDCSEKERLRLAAAVGNLVVNALEHGQGPVEITILPAAAGTRALLTVRNDVRLETGAQRTARDPRRGHGLDVIRRAAGGPGARFTFGIRGHEAVATLAVGPGFPARQAG